jgi:hypothetical protein
MIERWTSPVRLASQSAATTDDAPLVMLRVLVEPVLSPDGGRGIGRRQLDTGASAVIAGRGGDRIWQRDDETIAAFEARVKALVSAVA